MVEANLITEEEFDLPEGYPRSNRGPNGEFQCRFCPEDDFDTGIGRYQHEQQLHPALLKATNTNQGGRPRNRDEGRGAGQDRTERSSPVEVIGGVRMDTVTELTRRFARSLQEVAPDMATGKKKGIITAFDEASHQMANNPGLLERFLNRCALLTSQVEYIKLMMLGLGDTQGQGGGQWSNWGNQGNGPMAMSFDPRTGNMVPMPIFMMGNNQPAGNGNPMVVMPRWEDWGRGRDRDRDDDRLTRREVAEIVKDALEETQERRGRHRHRPGFT